MNKIKNTILITIAFVLLTSISMKNETFSLTVEVSDLKNSKGNVQFTLYNKTGTIPDEDFKKYYKMLKAGITKNASSVTFNNIPQGKYAVNIFHDENNNGKIEKGFIFPTEGIGFSNFQIIGFSNRPNFEKASFNLNKNMNVKVKIVYM
jgi:uncharacterized protein (DUF2141 family)